ncbi:MAG: glycosyltransferase [Flavobacteriales bacterium]
MKILLMSIGSRGDMEPFLSRGQHLASEGHEVAFCFPEQFEGLAHEESPRFYPQDKALLDLIQGPEIRKVMGQVGSGLSRLLAVVRLLRGVKAIQQRLIEDQARAVQAFQPDQVIFHIKCIYPVLWALRENGQVKMLSPMPCLVHPVDRHPHIAFGKPRGTRWNRFTYVLAELALVQQSILGYGKAFIRGRGWHVKASEVRRFFRDELAVDYAYEPALFERPDSWPDRACVTGFRERTKPKDHLGSSELAAFLKAHQRVLYVGFGSMVNDKPHTVAEDVIAVCGERGFAVVMNRSWGGLEPPDTVPNHVFVVDNVPFEWLFPKVSAAVHHGGAGTTHSAFRCGVPQAIVPHIADQFFWSRQAVNKGAGVEGFPIKKWSRQRFAEVVAALESRIC